MSFADRIKVSNQLTLIRKIILDYLGGSNVIIPFKALEEGKMNHSGTAACPKEKRRGEELQLVQKKREGGRREMKSEKDLTFPGCEDGRRGLVAKQRGWSPGAENDP